MALIDGGSADLLLDLNLRAVGSVQDWDPLWQLFTNGAAFRSNEDRKHGGIGAAAAADCDTQSCRSINILAVVP